MRKLQLLLLLIASVSFVGCVTPYATSQQGNYNYEYRLSAPIESSKLLFENDTFAIAFGITDNSISTNMVNKWDEPIKVVWNDAAMVVYGKTSRIAHAGVKYNEVNKELPPITIPAKASLSDEIIASSSVHFVEGSYNYLSGRKYESEWVTDPFFPKDKKEMDIENITDPNVLRGQKISLLLPISVNGIEKYYNFVFEVVNVSFAPNPNYRAPYKRPKIDMQPGRHSKKNQTK